MREVTMDKGRLVGVVKENREKHESTFNAATTAYRQAVRDELQAAIEAIDAGGDVRTHVALPAPESHTAEYDTALEMLDWEEGDKVTLDRNAFEQYVLDKWHWSGGFEATTMNYLGEMASFPPPKKRRRKK